ncbi:MAG: hypothetical protein K2O41_02225 [Clostridia bacterium]|nr:hypothetical protein [Clostridia bacterium]MDE7181835.1 hypothetical protein [Clostridia bacterium]
MENNKNMVRYVKCPRCELNYIDAEKQEYCDVCIAELKGRKLQFADLDDEIFEEVDGELEQYELCPVCGVNRIRYGEKMCEACKKESEYEEEEEIDPDKDEEWKNYLDEEDDGDLTIDDETLQEELDADMEDEEESEEENEDDFFDDDVDSLTDLEDDEYDDDEDFDDEDDDDDF